jgi:hypothetical protein
LSAAQSPGAVRWGTRGRQRFSKFSSSWPLLCLDSNGQAF